MNRVCEVLGIEKPVIQGPMAWISTAPLVAAVSNAGGLGVLGVGAGSTAPEESREATNEAAQTVLGNLNTYYREELSEHGIPPTEIEKKDSNYYLQNQMECNR